MLTSLMWVFVLIQCNRGVAQGVSITELRVPQRAIVGGEAVMSCLYKLGDDNLYSIKWYKDGREFYRYLPSHRARGVVSAFQYFETIGVTVDPLRSTANVVTLVNLTSQSTGAYLCEVSGEAPLFASDSAVGFLYVYLAPDKPPEIIGLRPYYKPGEKLSAKCMIYATQPEINLQWFLNGEPVDKLYSHGPYRRVSEIKENTTDTLIQLSFLILGFDFVDGVMTVKCQSSLPPVYQSETIKEVRLLMTPEENKFHKYPGTEKQETLSEGPMWINSSESNRGTLTQQFSSKLCILIFLFFFVNCTKF